MMCYHQHNTRDSAGHPEENTSGLMQPDHVVGAGACRGVPTSHRVHHVMFEHFCVRRVPGVVGILILASRVYYSIIGCYLHGSCVLHYGDESHLCFITALMHRKHRTGEQT